MHRYFIKTPWLLRRLYSSYLWKVSGAVNGVYLTFDDGPHPIITPWVLDQLKEAGAKGSFFCIGDNVQRFPEIYRRIKEEGHVVGNHTAHHLNGWKTDDSVYIKDLVEASHLIETDLFRPPYGRIKRSQAKKIRNLPAPLKIIMWDVLTGDFDKSFTPEQCMDHIKKNAEPGSIIVYHDSEKAYPNLKEILPWSLNYFREMGWEMKKLDGF